MAGSGVRTSWASTIVGDLPPPTTMQQPRMEVKSCNKAHDQVFISMPPFTGRYNPDLYI